mgnify:CR=1 FL=1
MEKKRKHNFLIKSLILCDLQTYVLSFYAFLFFRSLADAEMLKYIPQHLIRGDFADDGAEVVEGLAEVLGEEVRSLA